MKTIDKIENWLIHSKNDIIICPITTRIIHNPFAYQ